MERLRRFAKRRLRSWKAKRVLHPVDWAWLVGFVMIAVAIVGYRWSALPLQIFDESRNANNALEMARSHHWLVPTFEGRPDHWNTKPPLLIWCMALLFELGLPPLWAVRLPSLLATIATTSVLLYFFRKQFDERLGGIAAALLLLGSYSWMGIHGARTGDYDTVAGFFMLCYVLAFWKSTEHWHLELGWLVTSGVCIVLAVMTKGIAGLFVLPALPIYAALTRRVKLLLRDGRFWLVLVGTASLCAGYYITRDRYDPGYLAAVRTNEWGGRFLQVNEEHRENAFYYLVILVTRFPLGMLGLPFALVTLRNKRSEQRSLIILCLLATACLLLTITAAQTKLRWYVLPATPFLSVAIGAGLQGFSRRQQTRRARQIVTGTAILVALAGSCECWIVTQRVLTQMLMPEGLNRQSMYGPVLMRLAAAPTKMNLLTLDDGVVNLSQFSNYSPVLTFYSSLASARGLHITRGSSQSGKLASGTWVLTCDEHVRRWLQANYTAQQTRQVEPCLLEEVK